MMLPIVSIIIVSYNSCKITLRCLSSIIEQTKNLEYEIIVVDNNSSDNTVEMIRSEFPDIRLLENKTNRGFAAGQNAGLEIAKGRYLLTLNSDMLFIENPLAPMLSYLDVEAHSKVGVLGPKILNIDGTVAPSARRAKRTRSMLFLGIINRFFNFKNFLPNETFLRKKFGFFLGKLHDNYADNETIKKVDFVDGMSVLFRRETLSEVGLFDEQYFFDSEIIDLSNRIKSAGWEIEFFPYASMIHLGHASRKEVPQIIVETCHSHLTYLAKFAPEDVLFYKKSTKWIVNLKIWTLVFRAKFSSENDKYKKQIEICKEVLKTSNEFDPSQVWMNEIIPTLDPV